MAIKPRLLWTCISLPVATHPNKHSCAEGEDLWRGEKAIIGQTQRGEPRRRAKNTSRSLGERQREVIQIERRCLIWHGAPLRHLISFNPCGRWKQGEELALPGEETTNLPQLATESLVCVCCWVTDSHLSVLWMSLTHKSLIPYNIRNVFTFKNTGKKKKKCQRRPEHPPHKFCGVSHTEIDSAKDAEEDLLSCSHGPSVKTFLLAVILMTINSQLTGNSPIKSPLSFGKWLNCDEYRNVFILNGWIITGYIKPV